MSSCLWQIVHSVFRGVWLKWNACIPFTYQNWRWNYERRVIKTNVDIRYNVKAKFFFDPESLFLVKLTTQNLFIRYFKCVKKNRPILVRIQLTLMAYNTCTCTNVLSLMHSMFDSVLQALCFIRLHIIWKTG